MLDTPRARTAQEMITAARQRFPTICAFGILPYRIATRQDRLSFARQGFFGSTISQPIDADEVESAMLFLSMLTATKTGRVDSYLLKHASESWCQRRGEAVRYISNGAMITAAVALGLVTEACGPAWADNPNVLIGVSERSVRRIMMVDAVERRYRLRQADPWTQTTQICAD